MLEFIMSFQSFSKLSGLATNKDVLAVKDFIFGEETILPKRGEYKREEGGGGGGREEGRGGRRREGTGRKNG